MSLKNVHLPQSHKSSIVTPVLKTTGVDIDISKIYGPISNLIFKSKINDRLVFTRLCEYISDFCLCPSVQSAYRAGHSTGTDVLKVESGIIMRSEEGNRTFLRLLYKLYLISVFDLVDLNISFERLKNVHGLTSSMRS